MDELRRQLLAHAIDVAAILNVVEDKDERDQLRLDFERRLEDEMYAGAPR